MECKEKKRTTISSEGKPGETDMLYSLCRSSCGGFCDECKGQNLLWCSEKAVRVLSCVRLGFISSTFDEGFVSFLNESQYSQHEKSCSIACFVIVTNSY